jgi:hypothetical protein
MFVQSSGPDPTSMLLDRGLLGLAVLVMAWIIIFFFRRLIKERDELVKQREEMIGHMVELVPLIKRSTEVIQSRKVFDEQNHKLMVDTYEVLRDIRSQRGK